MAWWWPDLISFSIIQLCHIWSQLKEDPLDYLGIERNENHNTLYRNTGNSPSLFGNTIIFDWCMPIHIFKILEMGWLTMYLYKTIKVEWYPWIDKSMDLHLFVALPNASLTVKDYQSMGTGVTFNLWRHLYRNAMTPWQKPLLEKNFKATMMCFFIILVKTVQQNWLYLVYSRFPYHGVLQILFMF